MTPPDGNGPPPFDDDAEEQAPSTEELARTASRVTDSANADAVQHEHGRGYLYVLEWETWIAWDGKRWDRTGAKGRVLHAVMLTARAEYHRCADRLKAIRNKIRIAALHGKKNEDAEIEEKREVALLKWHEQSQNMSRIEACVRALETRLCVSIRDLDKNPWLLNVRNGTIDLRSGELGPHERADLITQLADVEWDDHAACPTWDAFVRKAMGDSLELVMYLQRLVGYALSGSTREHVLAFFWGDGNNGKSTFVQTIRTLLGDYACAAPRDLLFEDPKGASQRHPAELARLYGVRFAVCAEVGEFVTLDEAKVKDLTGGDTIACRRMREDFWDLEPTHKLFVAGNHKPTVRGNDGGIWRRIRLVPWTVIVPPHEIDKDLSEKLRRELPGILRWAVHGCLEWQRNGLAEPGVVTEATKTYRAESDSVGDFFARHVIFDVDARVTSRQLREAYEAWCLETGQRPFPPKKVGARLRERGARATSVRVGPKTSDGWVGCRLKTDIELYQSAEDDDGSDPE